MRLGLNFVAHLESTAAERLLKAREQTPFTSTEDLALRTQMDRGNL